MVSLKVFKVNRTLVNKNEPVLYFMKGGPKRGFVREELQIVPRIELPLEGILRYEKTKKKIVPQ